MEALQAEQRAHRAAFEEHSRSIKRHRWLGVLGAILEWRATMLAGGVLAASWLKWPFSWPWRK